MESTKYTSSFFFIEFQKYFGYSGLGSRALFLCIFVFRAFVFYLGLNIDKLTREGFEPMTS